MTTTKSDILEALVNRNIIKIADDTHLRAVARRNLEGILRGMPVEDRREYYAIVGRGE
jgi:predicted transcriptional regulator